MATPLNSSFIGPTPTGGAGGTPDPHAASHENGGGDELALDGSQITTGSIGLARGGTGASLTDPNADRILFWDDSAGAVTWLTAGSGLTITDTTITATSTGQLTVEASTAGSGAPNVLLDSESGKVLTNEGTTTKNYHTLPAAAAGLVFEFIVQDTDGMRIVADTGDTIRLGASVSAGAGYTESTSRGDYIRLVAVNATEWYAAPYLGTWTTV